MRQQQNAYYETLMTYLVQAEETMTTSDPSAVRVKTGWSRDITAVHEERVVIPRLSADSGVFLLSTPRADEYGVGTPSFINPTARPSSHFSSLRVIGQLSQPELSHTLSRHTQFSSEKTLCSSQIETRDHESRPSDRGTVGLLLASTGGPVVVAPAAVFVVAPALQLLQSGEKPCHLFYKG